MNDLAARVVLSYRRRGVVDKILEIGNLIKEKTGIPGLKRKLENFKNLLVGPKEDTQKAEDLIWRNPQKLEQALNNMSPDELKRVEEQATKILSIVGAPFWENS